MTPDEIFAALADPRRLDGALLRAAAAGGDPIVARLARLLARANQGERLTLGEQDAVVAGLAAAAAGRHVALWPAWCETLARAPDDALISLELFEVLPILQITLSLFPDRDAGGGDDLLALIDDPGTDTLVRSAIWIVLARLAEDGRGPRVKIMARFEAGPFAKDEPSDDLASLGWLEGAALLGAARLGALFETVLAAAGTAIDLSEADAAAFKAQFAASAEAEDLTRFEVVRVAPVDDAAAAFAAMTGKGEAGAADVGGLCGREATWLTDALAAEQRATLEALDGMMAADLAGPASGGGPMTWESPRGSLHFAQERPEVERAVRSLLSRRWTHLQAQIAAGAPWSALLEDVHPNDVGAEWAWGFLEEVARQGEIWAPLERDARAAPALGVLRALEGDELSDADRLAFAADLPAHTAAIARYWRDPAARALRQPVRSDKIGRNAACPCGSGQKYKKCCGATA